MKTGNKFSKRGDIYWVALDPTVGSEINKTQPALIISNDAANEVSKRVIVAPITSSADRIYPFEVAIEINKRPGKIMLDQIRSIDKIRLTQKITTLDIEIMEKVNIALKISLAITS